MLLHYKTGLSAKSLWIAPPQFFLRVHVDSEKRHSSPCSSHSSTYGKRVGYFQRPRNHEGRRDYPQYLFDTISYYDYREDYYHAFLAGLLSGAGYIVKSNRETGTGRADIMVLDKRNRRAAVFEINRSLSKDAMDEDVGKALKQVGDRKYGKDLDGYRTVLFYGTAFFEKVVSE